MDMPKRAIGFIYVLSNEAMPEIVKVGMTTKLAEDRAKELHSTGVPLGFSVEFRAATSYIKAVELKSHAILAPLRVAGNREFFRAAPPEAIDAVKEALLSVSSIDAWNSERIHTIKHGDRIAFTMKADDLFAVLSYPDLMASRAEPIDFWQSHSDGDLLELMGTADPGHVAGFSDADQGGDTDPVPYLDRDGKVPNGSINGRERLAPGQRLLWMRPTADSRHCKKAIFEMGDYCQVISRTWEAKFNNEGYPRLLNILTYDQPPPCVVRETNAAMHMAFPRSWTPPTPVLSWLTLLAVIPSSCRDAFLSLAR
jgi:hypothetical protein